ncbi:MAG: hypothetical protein HY042_10895, partial [Spirochaetia bacterium]|nr:hypothetical protein [Spirochaetia bacterium]
MIKDRIKEPFSAEQAEAAVDLLYVFAYSNVNALNILFFYMKKVNLFSELHAEKSVHFHRLKVDTAIERNRRRLRKSRQKLTIPGARNVAELLVAEDPFDARAFAELEHGYKISSEPARQAGDLSLLYGYAYTLTQKSVEREQFYDEIRRSGTLIPEEAFKEKKENILKDMKTAEYQLRYILLVDPVNADAYLLMGWMYQYLDERKSMTVRREAGYVERFYNWVTKTRPAAPTEGRQYYSLYANYFPEQLFESNVELYRQALNLRSGIPDNAMETAHLNLNLGNNYFHLLNFKRAAEAYSEVDKATLGRGQQLFSSYRQEGLFRFNFARSLYYEGKNDQAAVQFEKAHLIYYSNEKKPLDEAAAALRYRRDQSKDADRQSVERHLADNARALKESRFR